MIRGRGSRYREIRQNEVIVVQSPTKNITGWALRITQGEIGDIQTGRCHAYAAADRSETGKSNDLCNSLVVRVRKS